MMDRLKACFSDKVVYKDLSSSNVISSLSMPSYTRDWLLRQFVTESGDFNEKGLIDFINEYVPRDNDWTLFESRIVKNKEHVKLLASLSVHIDKVSGSATFSLPYFNLYPDQTIIEDHVWDACKAQMVNERGNWGLVELGYRSLDNSTTPIQPGKIELLSFQSFSPCTIDLDHYKDARNEFSVEEWIDILLGAVDCNANGYKGQEEKLTTLTRLLPFVEKRLHLIELGSYGTGKSYFFGNVSRFGWLSSGGVINCEKLFYDSSKRSIGILPDRDYIALDEVQTTSFPDDNKLSAALRVYMQNGTFFADEYEGYADAGIILCDIIRTNTTDNDETINMFNEMPGIFRDPALIYRFQGFIKGWNIPRMTLGLKASGWALSSDYFCDVLHELRNDTSYRAVVDKLIIVPENANEFDVESIKRITSAYLKLLFPNVRKTEDITAQDFKVYCLDRACPMRATILKQVKLLYRDFLESAIPEFSIREELCKSN